MTSLHLTVLIARRIAERLLQHLHKGRPIDDPPEEEVGCISRSLAIGIGPPRTPSSPRKKCIAEARMKGTEANVCSAALQAGEIAEAVSDGGMRVQAHRRRALLLP